MKKAVCFVALVALLFSFLCACGSSRIDNVSDRAYEIGLAALESADEYIAGDIDSSTAKSRLDLADIRLHGDDCTGDNDILISAAVTQISMRIGDKEVGTGTMSKVKDARNDLARYLGK